MRAKDYLFVNILGISEDFLAEPNFPTDSQLQIPPNAPKSGTR